MTPSDDLKSAGLRHLETLIGFDTTSRDSNLALIGYVEDVLRGHGVTSRRVANADQTKANLYATIGPAVAGGVVLSGHTDVVPVDGQAWTSDPFVLTQRGERLYGRGTCDMKAFLALALAVVPRFATGAAARPLHLAFSYDEEVGCLGAPSMIRELVSELPAPLAVIVGEPTNMEVVSGHKGISTWRVTVKGHEAHSSLTHLGVSANMVAIGLMAQLRALAEALEQHGDPASLYHPPHVTLTIGLMQGDGGEYSRPRMQFRVRSAHTARPGSRPHHRPVSRGLHPRGPRVARAFCRCRGGGRAAIGNTFLCARGGRSRRNTRPPPGWR
jgi:acetylornithine deacetylase